MPYTLADFEGIYQISQGSYYLNDDDPRRQVNTENQISLANATSDGLEFSIVNQFGNTVLGPLAFTFVAGSQSLTFTDPDYMQSGQPLTAQVSLYSDAAAGFKSIYGVMIYGDPENVGVWGADILPS